MSPLQHPLGVPQHHFPRLKARVSVLPGASDGNRPGRRCGEETPPRRLLREGVNA